MDRHGRQMRLVEVGPSGQAGLERARVEVALGGLAGEIAARYLAGAGVGLVRVRDPRLAEVVGAVDPAVAVEVDGRIEEKAIVADFGLANPAARELAAGAHLALRELRAALRVAP